MKTPRISNVGPCVGGYFPLRDIKMYLYQYVLITLVSASASSTCFAYRNLSLSKHLDVECWLLYHFCLTPCPFFKHLVQLRFTFDLCSALATSNARVIPPDADLGGPIGMKLISKFSWLIVSLRLASISKQTDFNYYWTLLNCKSWHFRFIAWEAKGIANDLIHVFLLAGRSVGRNLTKNHPH